MEIGNSLSGDTFIEEQLEILEVEKALFFLGFGILFFGISISGNGELAQLARAPALHAGGHRFDSGILHGFVDH